MDKKYLNLEALQDMADGDTGYECEIIQDILTEGDQFFKDILQCIEQQDSKAVGEVVHKFKGCISYVSSDIVINKYQKIESLSRNEQKVPSIEEIENLKVVYLKIKDLLNQYVKEVS